MHEFGQIKSEVAENKLFAIDTYGISFRKRCKRTIDHYFNIHILMYPNAIERGRHNQRFTFILSSSPLSLHHHRQKNTWLNVLSRGKLRFCAFDASLRGRTQAIYIHIYTCLNSLFSNMTYSLCSISYMLDINPVFGFDRASNVVCRFIM